MTTIFLVRHGEFENPENLIHFRLPGFPLSPLGKKQAVKLGDFFQNKKIAAIHTSPITRCHQTAEIIGNKISIKSRIDQNLIEVKSPFQGMPLGKYLQTVKDNNLYFLPSQIAKGETLEEISSRMQKALDEFLTKYKDKSVIMVSHGDPIMILVQALRGDSAYISQGGFYKLEFNGKKLIRANLVKSC